MFHKTRLILFYFFVAMFVIGGTGVLLYSYGWRIDVETGKAQKIGAIYVKTNVRDATIKISGKTYKDTAGILQSGTLISNLLPKTYEVEITKEGYQAYHKILAVQPSQVTEILNVQLIPQLPEQAFVAPTKGTRFIDATRNADKMILQNAATEVYYVYDKASASSTINLNLAVTNIRKGLRIRNIAFIPFNPSQFVLESATGFDLFDSEKRTIEALSKGVIAAWSMQDSTVIGVETNTKSQRQEAFTINLVFKSKTPLDNLNAQLATTTRIETIAMAGNGSVAFSDAKQRLFLFDPKTKTVKHIADNTNAFSFSPDGKKLAFLEANNPNVLFIEDFNGDIRKKSGERIAIALPQKNRTKNMHWHADSYHLLIEQENGLSITELDDRKPLNIFPILGTYIDYRYIPENNSIYFTDKKNISVLRLEK